MMHKKHKISRISYLVALLVVGLLPMLPFGAGIVSAAAPRCFSVDTSTGKVSSVSCSNLAGRGTTFSNNKCYIADGPGPNFTNIRQVSCTPASAKCYSVTPSTGKVSSIDCSDLSGRGTTFTNNACYLADGPGPNFTNIQKAGCTPASAKCFSADANSGKITAIDCSLISATNQAATFQANTCYIANGPGPEFTNLTTTDCNNPAVPQAPIDTSQNQNACVSSNALGWFLCKIFDGVGDASTWLFKTVIAPWLHEPPISLDPTSSSYQTWSAFRVYGDIFLVIALLVIVFGESIGGGLIDAYTVKKVLPRLLIAAILINLSLYIVAALVDIANVLGAGIGSLLTKGLGNSGAFHINLSGAQAGTITGVSATTGIGVILFALLVKGGASILASGIAYVGLLIISMVFFGLLAMFITLVLRQAGILILVLLSPVAFALYCLPNTEQYFRKWWELLLELLLMYPIIVMMFSAADLLSVAVSTGYNGNNPNDLLIRPVISFVLQFLPLFFIPFAFRIASKTIGRVNEVLHGVAMRGHEKVGKGMAQQYKQNTSDKTMALRERAYSSLKSSASRGGFIRRKGLGILAGQVGGYNMDARNSAIQAQRNKEVNDVIATGKDDEVRGLTVDKRTARMRTLSDGTRQFMSLGGRWVNEADVDRGWARWGHDKFAQQAALSYEMRKSSSEEEVRGIANNYGSLANAWGMSSDQASGAWIGSAFENQNQHLEYKYTNWRDGSMDQKQQRDFVNEIYEKRGSYNLAQMGSHTIDTLQDSYLAAQQSGDTAQQERIKAVAETFMHQYGGLQPTGQAGDVQQTGPPGSASRQANTPGAAHVAERVRELAQLTGIYDNAPTGYYSNPDQYNPDAGGATSPNRREQS